ncbi:U4/U6-U5 snRNP complex subunit prp38 [Turnera subulata]|uniref:Pre-mRNA-splicing factor 38 n=1 Tax=Turnera subulata TaxID=218843 RepID=A0A9Q0F668_9ROSI|nr:U4/U6-U5 snRNP complex subunit prp38 [Turnera subulata]
MANPITDPSVKSITGTNPENLEEKILLDKAMETTYWKEQCFDLTTETLVDKAMELDHIGGAFGGNREPTPFMCLLMKMLQIQPEEDIVVEFIKNEHYKYVTVLGAFYLRLTGTDVDVYRYLEPLCNDYRKLRLIASDGSFVSTHVDEVVEELLESGYCCDVALPRIEKRWTLENLGLLEPREKSSVLEGYECKEERKRKWSKMMDN